MIVPEQSPTTAGRTLASVAATILIPVVLGGWSIIVGVRLLGRSFEPTGDVFGVAIVDLTIAIWFVVAVWLAVRLYRWLRPPLERSKVTESGASLLSALFDVSALGAGALRQWTINNPDLDLLRLVRGDAGTIAGAETQTSIADHSPPPDASIIATREQVRTMEYVVQRGDTYWQLAHRHLGDGELWARVRDLNLGREIGPGVRLDRDTVLREGWRILVPMDER